MKKPESIIFGFLIILVICMACEKKDSSTPCDDGNCIDADIIGYLYCREIIEGVETDNFILGFYFITEENDSIYSFNIPEKIHRLSFSDLVPGTNSIEFIPVNIKYESIKDSELKHFDCPLIYHQDITPFNFNPEDFHEVNVYEIKRGD